MKKLELGTLIQSPCVPERGKSRECSFVKKKIYSPLEARELNLKPYHSIPERDGYLPHGTYLEGRSKFNLFEDYLKEFPVFVLKKGEVLVHATKLSDMYSRSFDMAPFRMKHQINKTCWWKHFYPGQRNYGGGWFTYETSYGGPEYFGLFLHYQLQKDIPVLFIPDYTSRFADEDYLSQDEDIKRGIRKYSGSHIVQGPRLWKEKGYLNVREIKENEVIGNYYADGLGYVLSDLGFNGYASCDECEVFLSHESMKDVLTYPFRIDYSDRSPQDEVLRFLVSHCGRQSSPLKVTDTISRELGGGKSYYTFEELSIED